ncbi:MAG: redoxin domain-containing protein [SAR324 cluster bacterium]|nr:redoxin domain-containing protein [SAR324 cluster bacterium]
MSLQEKLDAIKERSKSKHPPERRALMGRSIEELQNSGIMDKILNVGTKAPDFTLKNQNGEDVNLSALLSKGKVVLTIYRGKW